MEIFYDGSGKDQPDVFDLLRNLSFGQLKAKIIRKEFVFKQAAYTSRGMLEDKKSWFLLLWEEGSEQVIGIGEFSPLKGLSPDFNKDGLDKLQEVARNIRDYDMYLNGGLDAYPAVLFALETALIDLHRFGRGILFESEFVEGTEAIATNGLIWSGEPDFMVNQINALLEAEFQVLKMKIGALPFEQELHLLSLIRERFGPDEVELRLDANGAFSSAEALRKLDQLAEFDIHSIEQPIRKGLWEQMEEICRESPIPIALDEELIGIYDYDEMQELLDLIMPRYIILKPTLCGGLSGAESWANHAEERGIGWWATSALESNIGLNAIAQWTYIRKNPLPHGLGTGSLYTENAPSPLYLDKGLTRINPEALKTLPKQRLDWLMK